MELHLLEKYNNHKTFHVKLVPLILLTKFLRDNRSWTRLIGRQLTARSCGERVSVLPLAPAELHLPCHTRMSAFKKPCFNIWTHNHWQLYFFQNYLPVFKSILLTISQLRTWVNQPNILHLSKKIPTFGANSYQTLESYGKQLATKIRSGTSYVEYAYIREWTNSLQTYLDLIACSTAAHNIAFRFSSCDGVLRNAGNRS